MSEGPRIYNVFPLLAGPLPRWRPHLERARAMGFTWLFVNSFHQACFSGSLYAVKDHYDLDKRLEDGTGRPAAAQLRDLVAEASRLGLTLMMDLVINHTAIDSALLGSHPDWYAWDRDGRIVHPGAKEGQGRVVWGDLAQVDNAGSSDRAGLWAYLSNTRGPRVVPSIGFPGSHDTPRLAAELDGDRAAVLQRYAFAATFSTGVMMPIGFEYGFRKRLDVVKTRPEDWENTDWDLTGAIAAIHRTKQAHRALNEEGPVEPRELGSPQAFGFLKSTRDRRGWALVALNLNRTATVRVRVPPEVPGPSPLAGTDPMSGQTRPLLEAGELDLPPSGTWVIHPAWPGSAPGGARAEGEDA